MRIKEADDKQPQLDALTALLDRRDVDADTRRRIERAIKTMRAGIAGERDAAYEIDFHFAGPTTWLVIHDLRIEVNDRVAQIDHLLVNRRLDIWLLESKHFSEGVAVNEHGEWTGFWRGRAYGTASPIEQNRRHIAVLQDAIDSGQLRLPKRFGALVIKPRIRSLVLVSNGARITRPKSKAAAAAVEGLDTVIKAERLRAAIEKDSGPPVRGIGLALLAIHEVGLSLVALHRPATVDWAARFGLPGSVPVPPADAAAPAPSLGALAGQAPACQQCGRAVSPAVVEYCAANAERFGGRLLCYDCQRAARRAERASAR